MQSCQQATSGVARRKEESVSLLRRVLDSAQKVLHERRRANADRRELRLMGEHMLRDVGLGRDGAERAWFD